MPIPRKRQSSHSKRSAHKSRRRRPLRILKRARIAVALTFAGNGFGFGAFVARLPDFKQHLHLSNTVLGNSLFFQSAGVLISLLFSGRLCAKFGSAPVTFWGSIAIASSMPLVGLQLNLIWFWVTLFAFGFSQVTQDVAMNAHAVTLEDQSKRRFMGGFHALWSLGALIGGAFGGLFAQFHISTFIQSLSMSALILAIAFSVKPLWLDAAADKHAISKGPRVKRPPIFWAIGIVGLFASFGEGSASDWGGVLARTTYHAAPFLAAIPYIVFLAMMVAGRFSGDFLAERFGAEKVLLWGGAIGGGGFIGGLLLGNIYSLIGAWFLLGIGVSTVIPLVYSAAGSIAIKRYPQSIAPSSAVAMVSGISYSALIAGPPLVGFLADHITLRYALLVPATLVLLLAFGSRLARDV